MQDVLRRLQLALPRVREWIIALHAQHRQSAVPVARLGFTRLPGHFPARLLQTTRSVIVPSTPFPPLAHYGLPEFAPMAAMEMGAITFGDMYFVRADANSESLHVHEMVHVVQWGTLGVDQFLLTYAIGILEHGYRESLLEAIAYDSAARFDSGVLPCSGFVEDVANHAVNTRDAAAVTFARHGLSI